LTEGFFVVLVAMAIRQSSATTSIYLIEIIADVCPPEWQLKKILKESSASIDDVKDADEDENEEDVLQDEVR
jgi:hypothetical protein